MLRKCLISWVLLFGFSYSWADKPPMPKLYRYNGRVVVAVPPTSDDEVVVSLGDRYYQYEGSSSRVTITFQPQCLTIDWKIDIIGANWFHFVLNQWEDGWVDFTAWAVGVGDQELADPTPVSCSAESYWQLIRQPGPLPEVLVSLLHRSGQDPYLPDLLYPNERPRYTVHTHIKP
jgi:hypothetical protein